MSDAPTRTSRSPDGRPGEGRHAPSADDIAGRYLDAVLAWQSEAAVQIIADAADTGTPVDVLYDALISVQAEVGDRWEAGTLSVGVEHFCSSVTQLALARLHPWVFTPRRANAPSLVATCAPGDQHELPLRFVADVFALHGWRTVMLGADTPYADVPDVVAATRADLVLVSATLEDGVAAVGDLVQGLRTDPRTADVRVLVGGRAFCDGGARAREVGADGTARTAADAVATAARLVVRS